MMLTPKIICIQTKKFSYCTSFIFICLKWQEKKCWKIRGSKEKKNALAFWEWSRNSESLHCICFHQLLSSFHDFFSWFFPLSFHEFLSSFFFVLFFFSSFPPLNRFLVLIKSSTCVASSSDVGVLFEFDFQLTSVEMWYSVYSCLETSFLDIVKYGCLCLGTKPFLFSCFLRCFLNTWAQVMHRVYI